MKEQANDIRKALAKEILEIWQYELGEDIDEAWFASDDAKVIALDNIKEYLQDIINKDLK